MNAWLKSIEVDTKNSVSYYNVGLIFGNLRKDFTYNNNVIARVYASDINGCGSEGKAEGGLIEKLCLTTQLLISNIR